WTGDISADGSLFYHHGPAKKEGGPGSRYQRGQEPAEGNDYFGPERFPHSVLLRPWSRIKCRRKCRLPQPSDTFLRAGCLSGDLHNPLSVCDLLRQDRG